MVVLVITVGHTEFPWTNGATNGRSCLPHPRCYYGRRRIPPSSDHKSSPCYCEFR